MSTESPRNRRILLVDDNEDIHHDFHRILDPVASSPALNELDELEASILGVEKAPSHPLTFELASAFQGAEALAKVQGALREGTPYALAFIDVRMPPGWDGIETLARIWREDPCLQAVICSAYSDYSWESINERLGQTDQLLFLKKPFDPVEVRQIASALVERWNHARESQRTEQALRTSEAQLRKLYHALPDAILRVAADGTCLDFKPPRDGAVPLQPAFAPGSHLGQGLPEEVARRMLAQLGQALSEGTTHVIEYTQALGGEERCFEARIAAIDAQEALIVLRDISDRGGA